MAHGSKRRFGRGLRWPRLDTCSAAAELRTKNVILFLTLFLNLVGSNIHTIKFGTWFYYVDFWKAFYFCFYTSLALFYALYLAENNTSFWAIYGSGIGLLFYVNDTVDLFYNPYEVSLSEWYIFALFLILWYKITQIIYKRNLCKRNLMRKQPHGLPKQY